MSYGKGIKQHGIVFKGKPIHEFRKTRSSSTGEEVNKKLDELAEAMKGLKATKRDEPKSALGRFPDKATQRGEIAKRLLAGKGDSEIVKELGVAKSSVYVVKVKTGPDGRYSSGSKRTRAELEEIVKKAGLTP